MCERLAAKSKQKGGLAGVFPSDRCLRPGPVPPLPAAPQQYEDVRDTEPPQVAPGPLRRAFDWLRSLARLLWLLVIFSPAALTAPVVFGYGVHRKRWLTMFRCGGARRTLALLALLLAAPARRAQAASRRPGCALQPCTCTGYGTPSCGPATVFPCHLPSVPPAVPFIRPSASASAALRAALQAHAGARRPGVHQVGAVGGHAARPLPPRPLRRAGEAAHPGGRSSNLCWSPAQAGSAGEPSSLLLFELHTYCCWSMGCKSWSAVLPVHSARGGADALLAGPAPCRPH